ncbi:MAG TPA: VanZ family protein [Methylomirabilota bacterium]|nr:VanZ family protein [Methylomirabilota bacterium]
MAPIYWLPPLAWMAVIFVLSTDVGSSEHTRSWLEPVFRAVRPWATDVQVRAVHAVVRKAAHVIEYAILAVLWFRAFARGRAWPPAKAASAAFGLAAAWAVVDEAHQAFVASRGAAAGDVLIDTIGAAAAALVARFGWRAAARGATTALLWTAALGGAGALLLNAAAGVPSGALWLTAPASALLLARRRWRAR